jgi:protein MPE1
MCVLQTTGHWIQECPTNENREYDNRPRIKRTTGIPRSFLTTVEGPTSAEAGAGVMVTPDGGFVVARPDKYVPTLANIIYRLTFFFPLRLSLLSATWNQHRSLTKKNLSAADVHDLEPSDPDLQCPLCSKLLRDAVKTPCCSTSFCESCIKTYLEEHDYVCPECESVVKDASKLEVDDDRRQRVNEYVDEVVRASRDDSVLPKEEPKDEEMKKGDGSAEKQKQQKSDGEQGSKGAAAAAEKVKEESVEQSDVRCHCLSFDMFLLLFTH